MPRAALGPGPRISLLAALAGIGVFALAGLTFLGVGGRLGPPGSPKDPCGPPVGGVIWDSGNQGVNAYASPSVTLTLRSCETLMMTSGHLFGPDGRECGYKADQLCVVVYEATRSQPVDLPVPDVGHTWVGRTAGGYEDAIREKTAQFFEGSNCSGVPCSVATVLIYEDGLFVESRTLHPGR